MPIAALTLEATASQLAIIIDTDTLARFFGTRDRAVNINWIKCTPLTLGTAVDIHVIADVAETVPEAGVRTYDFNLIKAVSGILGSTGIWDEGSKPGSKALFRFTTVDVSPQRTAFSSTWPIFNTLVLGWSADVDFVLEFDYTMLDHPWNWREEIMRLLANKSQVADPNIANTQGKRKLVRAPLG